MRAAVPRVSLIMTVLNEERGLPQFLDSLSAQVRPPDEVVVVDGGSTDRTVELFEEWGSNNQISTRVLVTPGANISQGRNAAVRAAAHEVIAVTDAGTTLDPAWLKSLIDEMQDDVDVVAGFFEPTWTSWTERWIASVITPTLDEIDPTSFLPSSRSLLFTRDAWASAGGYPEWLDYCEDLVLDLAMKSHGLRFAFAPQAIARWSARPSLSAFAKQYYRYARGDGKAGLWRRRHALRYGAYGAGALLWSVPGTSRMRSALLLGFLCYNGRFFRRAWLRRPEDPGRMLLLLGGVPVVVVVGDLAKMAGYPVGVTWRARRGLPRGEML